MRLFVYPTLILLFLLSTFFHHSLLSGAIGIVAIITLVISAVYARGLYFTSGSVFLFFGGGLFIMSGQSIHALLFHFDTMLGILGLFLLLPFLNLLIKMGRYDTKLRTSMEHGMNRVSHLYRRSFIVCHTLGLFLNIATLPLVKESLTSSLQHLPKNQADRFYSQNLLRAYALCLTWSPMEVMVVTSLDVTGTSYLSIFPVMVLILIIVVSFDWIVSSIKYRHWPLKNCNDHVTQSNKMFSHVQPFILLLLTFFLAVSTFHFIFQKGYLLSIVILIVPITVSWAFVIKKGRRFFQLLVPLWRERTNGLANYFYMFLSAGFFVEMLSQSNHLLFLQEMFYTVSNLSTALPFFCMIAGYFLITSLIGFHPLVSFTLLIELLRPFLDEVSSPSLAIVFIVCSLSTVLYSPFNLSVTILADSLKLNPYRVGMWNFPFALLYISIGIFIAYLVTWLT
ncbi:hypothetical protein [Halalkalibacterium halodurans]|uniref:hypothetical protein n=1 Tax=Halalkalibacterium halodurans TaxID=86665 RepID=UPI002AAA1161|nr:hypothetical protein [Halalkalibacterium halodurans]MDY7220918.1 hypothetical protein [Halalkalibacterium halodurans]MDY7240157.1 hypothetical protein [Halalkalibacterium halodurans]